MGDTRCGPPPPPSPSYATVINESGGLPGGRKGRPAPGLRFWGGLKCLRLSLIKFQIRLLKCASRSKHYSHLDFIRSTNILLILLNHPICWGIPVFVAVKRIQPSGSQKRKLKKTKTKEAQSLVGSLSKYLSNFEENKSGVAEEINQAIESGSNIQIIDIETANIDVTLFLAQQNLAFRGHCEDISSENRGNFLELVQLLAKCDPMLQEHCLKLEEAAGFFLMSGKTAADMSKDILQQLEKDGLDIALCRAQGYDNAASMSNVHGGVQRKIREVNPKALFSPCSNHSLNLCGVHAFVCVPSSVTCFGTIEKLYSFFSSSTQRWQLLKEKTGKNLKRFSDTHWSAHYESVKVVKENIETIVSSLEHFQDPTKANLYTRSGASLLLPAVCDFTFLTYIQFWLSILEEVNLVQQYLQSPKKTLDTGITKLNALNEYLVTEQTTIVDNAVTFGIKKCNDMDINIEKRGRRRLKRTMPGESAHDAGLSIQEQIRRSMYEYIDRFIQELSARYGTI
ncbi:52 kDa repressor of the inhibitor of the protein kinase [Eumeta japonica]|uniref:52 kDa repressor of the inhibitor of the protein kinase n=1 Tax=Eumeta variegata TaxID=151549 RepID=A0A4C1U355_EUMVA|nr:52 kDa repressor of the inhibitor of the protein kinase [Eumeta japonica]